MKTKFDKNKTKKIVEETATKTVKFTFRIVKLAFIIILIYTILVSLWIYFRAEPDEFLTEVATLSIGGFWAFFLGYFGWRMGQTIEEYFTQIKKKK